MACYAIHVIEPISFKRKNHMLCMTILTPLQVASHSQSESALLSAIDAGFMVSIFAGS